MVFGAVKMVHFDIRCDGFGALEICEELESVRCNIRMRWIRCVYPYSVRCANFKVSVRCANFRCAVR